MGSLYKNKYHDKNGNARECANWWAQYYTHGKCIRENTNTPDLAEAKRFLKRREGDATKGRIAKSMHRKVAYSELARLVGLVEPGEKACVACHGESTPSLVRFEYAKKLPVIDHWTRERAAHTAERAPEPPARGK